jgi:hypothetical protein
MMTLRFRGIFDSLLLFQMALFFSTQKVFSLAASALDFDALQILGFH